MFPSIGSLTIMVIMARAGAGRNQESGTRNLIHVYHENNRIPSIWTTFYCFPRHVSRRLDQKCRSQDLNQYSNRVLKLQMAASPAMSDSKSVCPDGLTFLLSLFSFKSENKKKKNSYTTFPGVIDDISWFGNHYILFILEGQVYYV